MGSVYDSLNRPKKPHIIEDISFRKDFIACSCGMKGTIAEYDIHRREMNRIREADLARRRAERESA
jgi:hypothetical protein